MFAIDNQATAEMRAAIGMGAQMQVVDGGLRIVFAVHGAHEARMVERKLPDIEQRLAGIGLTPGARQVDERQVALHVTARDAADDERYLSYRGVAARVAHQAAQGRSTLLLRDTLVPIDNPSVAVLMTRDGDAVRITYVRAPNGAVSVLLPAAGGFRNEALPDTLVDMR